MWPLGDQERLQQSRASLSLSDLPLLFSISKTFHKQLEIQRKAVLDGIYLRKKNQQIYLPAQKESRLPHREPPGSKLLIYLFFLLH